MYMYTKLVNSVFHVLWLVPYLGSDKMASRFLESLSEA